MPPHPPPAKWIPALVGGLFGLFPVVSLSVDHGGSIIYTSLLLLGIAFAWPAREVLTSFERLLFAGYLLLFLLALLSLGYSEDIDTAWKRLERYFRLATFGVLYLLVLRAGLAAGRPILVGALLGALSLLGQAVYEVHLLGHPLASGLYMKIIFGDMAVLIMAILAAALVTVARTPWHFALLIAAIAAAGYAAVLAAARGAWIFLPVLVVLLLWEGRGRFSKHLWLPGAMLLGALAVIGAFQFDFLVRHVNQAFADLQLYAMDPSQHSSLGDRLNMWRNALLIWGEHPLLGTGIGDFATDSRGLIEAGASLSSHAAYGHAHSIYFDALATLGAAGLLTLVVVLFVVPGRLFLRGLQGCEAPWPRFHALAGLLTLAAFAVFGLSEGWLARNPFVNPYLVYTVAFAAGLSVSCRETG